MGDAPAPAGERGGRGERGGFGRGFGGRGRGGRRGRRDDGEEKWVPCTKLGRLVQAGKIRSLEEIYLHSIPIKVSRRHEPPPADAASWGPRAVALRAS